MHCPLSKHMAVRQLIPESRFRLMEAPIGMPQSQKTVVGRPIKWAQCGCFFPAWYLWAPGAGPRQKGENHAEAWPPASTRRTLGRYPFHTMRRWPTQDRWIHSPGDQETVTIHFPRRSTHRVTWKPCGHGDHSFHPRWSLLKGRGTQKPIVTTQDDHHHTQVKPTHDAPIGSRTPAATGEDDPRKEWKVLVTFSVTPVPMEHSSDLRSLLWPDCTLSPLSPKDESEPVGDPVVSDPMYPRGIHLSCDRPLTLLGRNRRSCPPRA